MTTARSLWNGTWVIRDHAPSGLGFAPTPADIDALPPAAQPLVRALLGAGREAASSARLTLADERGGEAEVWVQLGLNRSAQVQITGANPEPLPPNLPRKLGVTEAHLLELAHHGLWVLTPDGRSRYVNTAMASLLDYEPAGLLERSFLSIVEGDDRRLVIALFDHTADGHRLAPPEPAEVRLCTRKGEPVWTELSVHRVSDSRGSTAAIVVMVSDLTRQRRRAEERLAADLRLLADAAPEPEPALEPRPSPSWRLAPGPGSPADAGTRSQPTAHPAIAQPVPTGSGPPGGAEAYRAAFTHAPVGMAIIELDGTIREANPAMAALLDPTGTADWPMRLTSLVSEGEQDELARQLDELRRGSAATLRIEVPLHAAAEGAVWTLLSAAAVIGADGRPAYAIAQAEDITERRVAEHDLVHQTLHDPLTGLGNRLLLRDKLQNALSIAGEVPFVVMFLDLDRFKSVNDTYGHDAGDALLVGVAQRLRRIVRAADTVARLGGDEFAIIAQGVGDREGASILAEKVRAALRAPFRVGEIDVAATASMGMVIGNREYATGDQLLRDADIAMYRAKDGGRDRHELFDDEIRLQEIERHETERTLHAALDHDGLKLHYQPVIDLHTGRAIGAEALLRISDEQALLTPDAFLAVAEDSRLILDVGAWVLREVCKQLARWSEAGFGHLQAWVNVTGLELASPRFSALVQRSLSAHRVEPTRLHLECTENVLLEASPSTIEHLRALSAAGVSVGIDDFGTGYSSLGYLRDLPVSFLKIDAAFTRRLNDPGGASMVEAIIGLGRSLGLDIVAEGVESSSQMEALAMLGCDMAQGHLFAQPGPIDTLRLTSPTGPEVGWT